MSLIRGNLFRDVTAPEGGERQEALAAEGGARIERIVSARHMSPPGFWYDSDEAEWVVLLAGGATLAIEGEAPVRLAPGDHLLLPARCRHRIEATDPATVWLAVHFPPGAAPEGGA